MNRNIFEVGSTRPSSRNDPTSMFITDAPSPRGARGTKRVTFADAPRAIPSRPTRTPARAVPSTARAVPTSTARAVPFAAPAKLPTPSARAAEAASGWTPLQIMGIVLGIAILLFVIWWFFGSSLRYTKVDLGDDTGLNVNSNGPTLVLFTSVGCPACERLAPNWQKVKSNIQSRGLINVQEYQPGPVMARAGVKKVPTIRFYPRGVSNDDHTEYSGDRSYESIIAFVDDQ